MSNWKMKLSKPIALLILVPVIAASCGDTGDDDESGAYVDEPELQVEEIETEPVDIEQEETVPVDIEQEEVVSSLPSAETDQGSDGSENTVTESETVDAAADSDIRTQASADEASSVSDEEPTSEDEIDPDTPDNDEVVLADPEEPGENCDSVKDRNDLRIEIESPALVINNALAKPGDVCDFHLFYVDGMSRGVNSNGIIQLSLTCEDPNVIEFTLGGPGGFEYRHGASNGQRYSCGDSWTESVNYQSQRFNITVYVRPLLESGASAYQIVAVPAPT